MKRTLAIALIAGALLLAGCSRPPSGTSSSPAPVSSPATAPAHRTSATSSGDDVNDLLNQVDEQLRTSDQPPSEQD